ncbi:ABC transporter ATP-binding protein [Ornithinibacillus scapharcae]|uniref:ABC transporter ATP-binding protein n=1 Tax=Ornithinibacillus scapharcae TaxID=1147159 RepID=UPI000225AB9C|nr:ABC transporter ATP-binding protein [Ornithinibacillus scapharcae]
MSTKTGIIRLVKTYLVPHWMLICVLFISVIVTIGLQLIGPQIIREFIDSATLGSTMDHLTFLAIVFLGIALIRQLITIGSSYLSEVIGWNASNELRNDLALHCLKLDMSFHNKTTSGGMIERIDGDVTELANFFSRFWVVSVSNFILLLGILVLLTVEDWRVGVIFTLFSLVSMLTINKIRRLAIPHWGSMRQASASLFGFIEERVAGAKDIKATGGSNFMMNKLYQLMRDKFIKERKASIIGGLTWNFTIAFFTIATALGLGIGVYLYFRNEATIGTVFMIYAYVQMLRVPIEQLIIQMQNFQRASASILRTQELFETKSEIISGPIEFPTNKAVSITFDNVTFQYEKEKEQVLNQVNLQLEAGKKLGVIGRTGSGKTTIIRLLLRLYQPSSGNILIDGLEIKNYQIESLRKHIAIVTQDVQLFDGTLRDNVTFFDDSISDNQIIRALEELGLLDWLHSLPDGLDTRIGKDSITFSAGEAQLFALTRVLIKNPAIVILDEATARIDPSTEKLMYRALDRLLENRTGIIIAHRLKTLQKVDEILVLDKGQVVEHGAREILEEDISSKYYDLLQGQKEDQSA